MTLGDDELWGVDDDRPVRPPRPARRPRVSQAPAPGRWLAVVMVLVVIAGVGVMAAAWPAAAPSSGSGTAASTAIAPTAAVDASSFCAAAPAGAADAYLYALNTTDREVRGTMASVGTTPASGRAPTVVRAIDLQAHQGLSFPASAGIGSATTASTFTFRGGGVAVDEAVATPGGWAIAPCPTRAAASWTLSGGDTASGDTTQLAIVNPTASPAVVNVSFLTDGGPLVPQPFQGLMLAPGQLVVESVGLYVQHVQHFATQVVAQSGAVVASQTQQVGSGTSGVSLTFGTLAASPRWQLARTTTVPGGQVTLVVANPWSQPVAATVTVALSGAAVSPLHVELAPDSTTAVSSSAVHGWPTGVPVLVVVDAARPVVVSRTVQAPGGLPAPSWGGLQPMSGPAPAWVVLGPGLPGAPVVKGATRASMAVANPGSAAARVVVRQVGEPTAVATLTVPAHQLVVLGSGAVGGLVPLTVTASRPVVVEDEDQPSSAPGVVATTGVPTGG